MFGRGELLCEHPLMMTAIDVSPRQRGWIRRVAALLILAVTAVLASVLYGAWTGEDAAPAMSADQLRAAVTTGLRTALEQATPAEHESHGHDNLGGTAKVICAVEVLGFEPTDAAAPDQVRKVYATHLCAVSDNGRPWDYATKTSGPLVATWGQPLAVQVIVQGDGYPDRVRTAIPPPYYETALGSAIDERALAELRTRFDASVAEFWAAFRAVPGE